MAHATGPVYKVAFRRRRKNLTNYAKRLALVKGNAPRMVVRKSGTGVLIQFIEFTAKGDKVIVGSHSSSLKKIGWAPRCNAPTAYLCGMAAGKAAKKKGVKHFNLDIGMQAPSRGSVVFAALKGAIDAGLESNYTEEMISEARISGADIAAYAKMLKEKDASKYGKLYSGYAKENFAPEKIVEAFKAAKGKIASGQ
ncbi:50S ribosomal protein L18 [uncultured archaeon]|nr:50S ribosomal protein L18 [uncultured archaeon]